MRTLPIISVLIFWCVILCGCAVKRPIGVNYSVPVSSLTAPVELVGCDTSSPPKNCKKAIVKFRPGSEQIVATVNDKRQQ